MGFVDFNSPSLLWLLLLLLPMIAYYVYRSLQGGATVLISSTAGVAKAKKTARHYLRHLPFVLTCAAVALMVVALARPQTKETVSHSPEEGYVDIVLSIDISVSMWARDFRPDRITVAREVASEFIARRPNDRIAIVVFAGESYTVVPLTTDQRALQNAMAQVRVGMTDDGTAIGSGLATAVNRLRESDAKSKVIVLLTDGVNNAGAIDPQMAGELAATYGIKVYTVGVGSKGTAPYPALDIHGRMSFTPAEVLIDEEVLQAIAQRTGGKYYRAVDRSALAEIYEQINQLEKVEAEQAIESTVYHENYAIYLLWAFALLVAGFLMKHLLLRQIP